MPLGSELNGQGEPYLFPNEEIYKQECDVTVEAKDQKVQYDGGKVILTTHRIIFVHQNTIQIQIPLGFVKKTCKEGSLFSKYRIEIAIDRN